MSNECRSTAQWVVPYSEFHGSPLIEVDDLGAGITTYVPFGVNGLVAHHGSGAIQHGSVANVAWYWPAVYGVHGYVPTANANWNTVAYSGSDIPAAIEVAMNDLVTNAVPSDVGGGNSDMSIVVVTTGHDLSSSGTGKYLQQQAAAAKAAGIRIIVIHVRDGYGDILGAYDGMVDLESIASFANPTGTMTMTAKSFYYQVATTADISAMMPTLHSDLAANGFPLPGDVMPSPRCLPNAPYDDCAPLGPMQCVEPCPTQSLGPPPFCLPKGMDAAGAVNMNCLGYAAGGTFFIVSHGIDPVTGLDSGAAKCVHSASGVWTSLPDATIARSQAAGAIYLGHPASTGYLVLGGKGPSCTGGTTGNICNTFERLIPGAGSGWGALPPLITPTAGLGAYSLGDTVYAIGGRDCDAPYCDTSPLGTLQTYNAITGIWGLGPAMPTARADFAVARIGCAIYVIGGNQGPGADLSSIDAFDHCGGVWTSAALPALPIAVSNPVAGFCGGTLVVVGGTQGGSPTYVVQRFNTPMTPLGWDPPVAMSGAGYRLATGMAQLGPSQVQLAAYPGDPGFAQMC